MDPFDMIGDAPNDQQQPAEQPFEQLADAGEYQSYPTESAQQSQPAESYNLLDDLFGGEPAAQENADPQEGEQAGEAKQEGDDAMADFLGEAEPEEEQYKDVFYEMPQADAEQMPEDVINPQKVAEIQNKNEQHLGKLAHEYEEQKLGLKREGEQYRTDSTKKYEDEVKETEKQYQKEQQENEEFVKGKGKKWLKVKKLMGELPKGRVGGVLKAKFEDEEDGSAE